MIRQEGALKSKPAAKRGPKPRYTAKAGTLGARVLDRLAFLGLSNAAAAEKAGVDESTIRAMINDPDNNPTLAKIVAVAAVLDVAPEWLAFGANVQTASQQRVKVRGKVAAGLFRIIDLSDETSLPPTYVGADSRYPAEEQYDLVASGTSINRIAHDGDYLRCVSLNATSAGHGDLVIVEMRTNGMVETTAKICRKRQDRTELWPASDDERWRDPIIVPRDKRATDKEVAIVAKVIFIYRPIGGSLEWSVGNLR